LKKPVWSIKPSGRHAISVNKLFVGCIHSKETFLWADDSLVRVTAQCRIICASFVGKINCNPDRRINFGLSVILI
jgi:hypothetical protein